jgi:hypothetical protein
MPFRLPFVFARESGTMLAIPYPTVFNIPVTLRLARVTVAAHAVFGV